LAHRDKFGRPTFGRKWVRRDESDEPVPILPIKLPLKIRCSTESFAIDDAAGRTVSYVYFEDELSRRAQTRRYSKDEARAIVQMIARLLSDVERNGDVSSNTILLEGLNAEHDE
jgi:hypothetical protein